MYFIIGVWGGPRRVYAAIKFFLFTLVGSLLMLVAIVTIVWYVPNHGGQLTFDIRALSEVVYPYNLQVWAFAAFFLAFAIKVPMFPLHTWLPDAHVEAPTGGSVILAGVLLKLGTYGFLRYAVGLFPQVAAEAWIYIVTAAVIGIVYGALVSLVQPDLKKLVAYSSVSHLGFVMLGMFAFNTQGVTGSIYQMLNHGLSTGALFLIVGVIYYRRHTRMIADFGGLWKQLPMFSVVFLVVMLSSVGLPGLNGFVGEFLILLGAFKSSPIAAACGTLGVILGAVYMLWMFQRVMFGELKNPANQKLQDLSAREIVLMLPLLLFVFWIGIYPNIFFEKMSPALEQLIQQVQGKQHVAVVETIKTNHVE
jgi:NADH-quinone oxidoreductase subunit M